MTQDEFVTRLDQTLHSIIDDWYERVKDSYVTQEDNRELGVEPEIKRFHDGANHRIKFARQDELDVTYGLAASTRNDIVYLESSVNNKSAGFDYDSFVKRLQSHYWRARSEKPWFEPDYDRFAYQDLLIFEPLMGQSVRLEARKDRADIIHLLFEASDKCSRLLEKREDLFRDLLENYCVRPLKTIYAECLRER